MADGKLNVGLVSEYKGDFVRLKESINQCINAFDGVLKEISRASEEVALGAGQLSNGSQIISQGSAKQAGELESFKNAVRNVTKTAKHNAQSAEKASDLAQSAKANAANGNEMIQLLHNAMTETQESSVNISKIIKVIDGIAFQTNILALNAAGKLPVRGPMDEVLPLWRRKSAIWHCAALRRQRKPNC